MMDLESLLLGQRAIDTRHEPFFYGCVDHYFPRALYNNLLATFPDESVRINYRRNNSFTLGDHSRSENDFFRERPDWKAVLEFFTSRRFLENLQAFLAPAILRDRGESRSRPWRYIADWDSPPQDSNAMPVKITFKFLEHPGNYSLVPHTDKAFMLFGMILYFPDPEWLEEYGGGTEFYSPKYSLLNRNWNDEYAPHALMNHRETFSYIPNRVVYLLKSAKSWHGFSPVKSPEYLRRRSVLVAFHAHPYDYHKHWRRVARWHMRQCIRTLAWMESRKQGAIIQ